MTDLDDLYPEDLRKRVEAAEAIEAGSETETPSALDAQINAYEMSMAREDQRADDLAGRQIGDWKIVGWKRNKRGRNVYVLRHRDGFMKGIRGHVLNAMLTEARNNGVSIR